MIRDVVVLLSCREGAPRTLLEGTAMGRPIAVFDVPGCREVVKEGFDGYLLPVEDFKALAEAVARISADPARGKEMGLNGARFRDS